MGAVRHGTLQSSAAVYVCTRTRGPPLQVSPSDFVVKAPPAGPKGAPAFSEYDYAADPYAVGTQGREVDCVEPSSALRTHAQRHAGVCSA